eukprot:SAG11_NODE_29797_length_307_cov_0.750000_1_plen_80_part_01
MMYDLAEPVGTILVQWMLHGTVRCHCRTTLATASTTTATVALIATRSSLQAVRLLVGGSVLQLFLTVMNRHGSWCDRALL